MPSDPFGKAASPLGSSRLGLFRAVSGCLSCGWRQTFRPTAETKAFALFAEMWSRPRKGKSPQITQKCSVRIQWPRETKHKMVQMVQMIQMIQMVQMDSTINPTDETRDEGWMTSKAKTWHAVQHVVLTYRTPSNVPSPCLTPFAICHLPFAIRGAQSKVSIKHGSRSKDQESRTVQKIKDDGQRTLACSNPSLSAGEISWVSIALYSSKLQYLGYIGGFGNVRGSVGFLLY